MKLSSTLRIATQQKSPSGDLGAIIPLSIPDHFLDHFFQSRFCQEIFLQFN